jgi:hypothetical protein
MFSNSLTCLADRNSRRGNIKCLSKYWPIREVRSNLAIIKIGTQTVPVIIIHTTYDINMLFNTAPAGKH